MTKSLPTLDVVVPCYNEEDTIADCLDGLLAQGKEIKHIIIVDNNSKDQTVGIVKSYLSKHPSITLLHEKRQGWQFARNTGLNKASSDIIGLIDSDAIVQLGWARANRKYYAKYPKLGAASGVLIHHDLPFVEFGKRASKFYADSIHKNFADNQWMTGNNMSLRRTTWQSIKDEVCMTKGILGDQDMAIHITQSGGTTGYIPTAEAYVSGRRFRTSPPSFWRYNKQCWVTFANHGQRARAIRIRFVVWIVNVLQAIFWVMLQFHDPVQKRFRFGYLFEPKTQ